MARWPRLAIVAGSNPARGARCTLDAPLWRGKVMNKVEVVVTERRIVQKGVVSGVCGTEGCDRPARWIPISEGNAGGRMYRCVQCCDAIADGRSVDSPELVTVNTSEVHLHWTCPMCSAVATVTPEMMEEIGTPICGAHGEDMNYLGWSIPEGE